MLRDDRDPTLFPRLDEELLGDWPRVPLGVELVRERCSSSEEKGPTPRGPALGTSGRTRMRSRTYR